MPIRPQNSGRPQVAAGAQSLSTRPHPTDKYLDRIRVRIRGLSAILRFRRPGTLAFTRLTLGKLGVLRHTFPNGIDADEVEGPRVAFK